MRTELHSRRGIDTGDVLRWMWLDVAPVVRLAMTDLDRLREVSVPGWQYRLIVAASRLLPPRSIGVRSSRVGRTVAPADLPR